MRVNLTKALSYFIDFFIFNGVYAITAIVIALNLDIESRYYNIPLRIVITLSMILVVVLRRFKPCRNPAIYLVFFSFVAIYWFRIIMEMVVGTADTHIPPYEYLLYTIIYLFFPFLYFSQRKTPLSFEPLFKAILYSGILFSIVIIIRFIQITLEYGRFDRFLLGFDPLTISYVGSLVVGICFSRLVFNRSYENTRLLLAGILFGLCPFLLGGSRGPIIALIIPFVIVYMYKTRIVITKRSLWYGLFIIIAITVALIIFGDIAFERLNNIFNDLASKSGDVRRLKIWNIAFSQFLESPVWGDSIQINYLDYPHNLLLEVLMSTGILGFIPFFILMCLGLYKSIIILRRYPSLIWLYIFFFQALIMGMLSGTVYNNIWYWASLALIFSIDTGEIIVAEKNPATYTSI